jgi:hypothetical protein
MNKAAKVTLGNTEFTIGDEREEYKQHMKDILNRANQEGPYFPKDESNLDRIHFIAGGCGAIMHFVELLTKRIEDLEAK